MRHFLLIILAAAFLGACSKSANKIADAAYLDSLRTTYTSLIDSTNVAWKVVKDADDQILTDLSRLLEEVTYTNQYEEKVVDSLMKKVESLKSLDYGDKTLNNYEVLDNYDMLTTEAITQITDYAENHPQYDQYPLMGQLITDIRTADQRILLERTDYDHHAKEFNRFVEANSKVMDRVDADFEGLKRKVFELSAREK